MVFEKRIFIFFAIAQQSFSQINTLYLIPGTGTDGRIFQNLKIENCVVLEFLLPEKNELLPDYAKRMAEKIDTSKTFSLLGVSFGGMVAVEISKFLKPDKVFVVSGAKTRRELPRHYRIMKYFPVYKLLGGKILNHLANFARPVWEPESRKHSSVFRVMTNNTPPKMIQRSVHCIVNWENNEYGKNVIHIHGEKDHTLPVKNIENPVSIKNGSHEIIFLNAKEVSEIINRILTDNT